jgi:hypothetical protein
VWEIVSSEAPTIPLERNEILVSLRFVADSDSLFAFLISLYQCL